LAADLQQFREAETTLLRAMTAPVGMQGQTHERVSRLETAMAELAERVSAFYCGPSGCEGENMSNQSSASQQWTNP